MAIYTILDEQAMRDVVAHYDIGRLVRFSGFTEGIENSNYLVVTVRNREKTDKEYVLTIAEAQPHKGVTFVARLLALLYSQGIPVPRPILSRDGHELIKVQDKPAVLMTKIEGTHPLQPNPQQCETIANALGRMHNATMVSALQHTSHRSLEWAVGLAPAIQGNLDSDDTELLKEGLLAAQRLQSTTGLPSAIIHGDLFRDNTLFLGNRLTGIIDFFSAGTGYPLFDLAVLVNDWGTNGSTRLVAGNERALLAGYVSARKPTDIEK